MWDLARNLKLASHEPAVVTTTPVDDGRDRSVGRADGFPVYRTAAHLPNELPVHPRAGRELDDLLSHLRPDVVHVRANVISPFVWSGIAAVRRARLPLAIIFHCVLGPWARVSKVLGPVSPVCLWQRGNANLTAVFSILAVQIHRTGAGDPVAALPNSITVEDRYLEYLGPQGRRSHRSITVVASLRWIEHRCPLRTVRAFAQAIRNTLGIDATLKICGDDPLCERLTRKVAESGLTDRVELVGRIERTKLAQTFARADIHLQILPAESFGIPTLEARSAGLAVAAIRFSGVCSLITDSIDGLLASDDTDLDHELATLLGGDELLERIETHNYEVAPLVEWSAMARTNVRVYRRAIALVSA